MPQMTIYTTAGQAARVAAAVGKRLSLETNDDPPVPRNATGAEIKAFTIQFLKETVRMFEVREAEQMARDAVADIEPN